MNPELKRSMILIVKKKKKKKSNSTSNSDPHDRVTLVLPDLEASLPLDEEGYMTPFSRFKTQESSASSLSSDSLKSRKAELHNELA